MSGEYAAAAQSEHPEKSTARALMSWPMVILHVLGVLAALWLFLFGLGLMGDAFKVMGGKRAAELFSLINNPIAGLMVGILATVLVQSSSTSTSVVVGLVSSDIMTVQAAIPVIMGANIGTSVTNTIVSMGHISNKDEFRRGFAGATVHDMFNYLSVLVLLPIEIIVSAVNGGGGGLLFLISKGLTSAMEGGDGAGTFKSPVKLLTSPATKGLISVDKDKIKAMSMRAPTLQSCLGSVEEPKVIAKVSYYICGNETALDESLASFQNNVLDGALVKKGALKGLGDGTSGAIALLISLLALIVALVIIVALLKRLLLSSTEGVLANVGKKNINGYLAMLIGAAATFAVQSSSIITSTLVPFVALNKISLESLLPLTLGANIGTTGTALVAALAAGKVSGLQIALCHFCFNIFGILIWYPAPLMRKVPLNSSRFLGYLTVCFTWFSFAYLISAFFVMPLAVLGISALFNSGDVGAVFGALLVAVILFGILVFVYFYKTKGLNVRIQKYLSKHYDARATVEMKSMGGAPVATAAEAPSINGDTPGVAAAV